MDCVKVTAGVRKAKKKQAKDELDRMKQVEKKNRRLQKALATSAAIRSELEKKKLKRQEQERLDEEGAATAEAVAMQVLLGDDSEESSSWDRTRNISALDISSENTQTIPEVHRYGCVWNCWGNSNHVDPSDHSDGNFCPQYFTGGWGPIGLSSGHLSARVVQSLEIADDT